MMTDQAPAKTEPSHSGDWTGRLSMMVAVIAVMLAAVAMLAVIAASFAETRRSLNGVERAEMVTIARAVKADLDRAIAYGVPLGELSGLGAYLDQRAGRLADARLLAVVSRDDSSGVWAVGPAKAAIPDVVRSLRANLDKLAVTLDEDLIVGSLAVAALPLRDGAGWVLVGREPARVFAVLANDLARTAPFWIGCLVLVAWVAWTVAARAIVEPFDRLRWTMTRGAGGVFDTLLIRRSRDSMGRCLLATNAIAAGAHARLSALVSHADEVRGAVFDRDVADAVTRLRDDLAMAAREPPRRIDDVRPRDADLLMVSALTAAALTLAGPAITMAASSGQGGAAVSVAAALVALGVGVAWGAAAVARHRVAIGAMMVLVIVTVAGLVGRGAVGAAFGGLGFPVMAAVLALPVGIVIGLAAGCRRDARALGPIGGGDHPWLMVAVVVAATVAIIGGSPEGRLSAQVHAVGGAVMALVGLVAAVWSSLKDRDAGVGAAGLEADGPGGDA